jgi:protein-L-isoaspartate O-methyltransferase
MTKTPLGLDDLVCEIADQPVVLARLAALLLAKGHHADARKLCERAALLAPDEPEIRVISAEVLSYGIPRWHPFMVQDYPRNAAYERAFRRAIRPSSRVLELGTGSGLLAMMAARAGAAEVITCERNPAVAAVASNIIARNGYADCIRVISKDSSDLAIGADFDERADILVFELLADNLIGEGVLPAVEQAARRLLRQGASIIPAQGKVRVALAEDREAEKMQMGMVEGFDLSPFNRFAPPHYRIAVGNDRLVLRSEPIDLFEFDFQSGGPFPEGRAEVQLISRGGRINGIAQWFLLEMDEEGSYEVSPTDGITSHWAVRFYPLTRSIKLAPGAGLTVCSSHDRLSLRIWTCFSDGSRGLHA